MKPQEKKKKKKLNPNKLITGIKALAPAPATCSPRVLPGQSGFHAQHTLVLTPTSQHRSSYAQPGLYVLVLCRHKPRLLLQRHHPVSHCDTSEGFLSCCSGRSLRVPCDYQDLSQVDRSPLAQHLGAGSESSTHTWWPCHYPAEILLFLHVLGHMRAAGFGGDIRDRPYRKAVVS